MKFITTATFTLLSLLFSLGVSAAPVQSSSAVTTTEKRYCVVFPIPKCATCTSGHLCPEKRDGGFEMEMEKRAPDEDPTKRTCFVNPLTGKGGCTVCPPKQLCPLKREAGLIEIELV